MLALIKFYQPSERTRLTNSTPDDGCGVENATVRATKSVRLFFIADVWYIPKGPEKLNRN
jgi:hypothetical protein